jgi:hypothetical protein
VGFAPWELGFSVRGYAQRHADFYADVYDERMRYMTGDRKLGTYFDVFAGPRLALEYVDVGPFSALRFELKVIGNGFWYTDFDRQPNRYGFVADLGMGGVF